MAKKVPYANISSKLSDVWSASYSVYKNHAAVAGYYESTLVSLIAELPGYKQQEMMRIFERRIEELQQRA